MLQILTFLVLFSKIEMYYTLHNRAVTLKINDLVVDESKNGKNEVNKGKIYNFVDQEDVKVTCNAYNMTSKYWVLYMKEGQHILMSYCSDKGGKNGEIVKNTTLTADKSGRHYKCELFIGSQLRRSKINNKKSECSVNEDDLEATTSIVVKVVFRVAKLNIFVNKCMLQKNNISTEVIYKYRKNENLFANCTNDGGANAAEWLWPAFSYFSIKQHKLSATLHSYNKNGLTAKDNGSYFDCIEKNYLNYATSRTYIKKRPTLRLRLILLDDAEKRPEDDRKIGCSFDKKDVCISGYEQSKVTGTPDLLTYKYSDEEKISLTCHATTFQRHTKFYIKWKKGDEAASNETTSQSQTININLLSTPTRTNYTCMVILPEYSKSDRYLSVIEFVYNPPNRTKGKQLQSNSTTEAVEKKYILILVSTIFILAAISIIIIYAVMNRKKTQKEYKQRLHSEFTTNSQGNISVNNTQSLPQLCETYATPQTNAADPSIYCDPYVALYSQPIPKSLRNPKKRKNENNIHYSNEEAIRNLNINNTTERYVNLKNVKESDGEMYSDPSGYDYVL